MIKTGLFGSMTCGCSSNRNNAAVIGNMADNVGMELRAEDGISDKGKKPVAEKMIGDAGSKPVMGDVFGEVGTMSGTGDGINNAGSEPYMGNVISDADTNTETGDVTGKQAQLLYSFNNRNSLAAALQPTRFTSL
jgi:hypothetical protein